MSWNTTPCKCRNRSLSSGGYAYVRDGDRTVALHRKTWEDVNGPIPEGMLVLHHCDVRNCYEITHLFLGTHQDNMDDMKNKGRANKGEKVGNSILTEEKVRGIKLLLKVGERQQDIADEFGVSRSVISNIKAGRRWAHVRP